LKTYALNKIFNIFTQLLIPSGVTNKQEARTTDPSPRGLRDEQRRRRRNKPQPLFAPMSGASGVHQRKSLLRRHPALSLGLRRGQRLVRALFPTTATTALLTCGGGSAEFVVHRPGGELLQGVLPTAQETSAPQVAAAEQFRQRPLV
jgi:hypothetical protein